MIIGAFQLNEETHDWSHYKNLRSSLVSSLDFVQEFESNQLQFTFYKNSKLQSINCDDFVIDNDVLIFIVGNIFDSSLSEGSASALLSLYKEYGIQGVHKLEGEYVIGIFNFNKDEYFIVRDHVGAVPLGYTIQNNVLYFGSEQLNICKYFYGKEPIDRDFIEGQFYTYASNYRLTPNKNFIKLLPGNYLDISTLNQVAYWFPEEVEKINISKVEVIQELERRIIDAIKHRSNESVQIAAHLSGGLDSSLVAVLVSRLNKLSRMNTYCWSPSVMYSKLDSEQELIESIGEQEEFNVIYTNLSEKAYDRFIRNVEYPEELLYEAYTAKKMNEHNDVILFSGFGGDEFLGLPSIPLYRQSLFDLNIRDSVNLLKGSTIIEGLKNIFNNVIAPKRNRPFYKYKTTLNVAKYLKGPFDNRLNVQHGIFSNKNEYFLEMLSYLHLPGRMDDWYVHSQKEGYVYRYPLLSKGLIEFLFALDYKLFLGDYKDRVLLRSIGSKYLPEEVYLKPKNSDPSRIDLLNQIQFEYLNRTLSKVKELYYLDYQFAELIKMEDLLDVCNALEIEMVEPNIKSMLYFIERMSNFEDYYTSNY